VLVDLPERTSPTFLLNCHLYIEQRTVLLNFLHHHNFRRNVKTLLFGDSPKSQAQHLLLSKAVPTCIKKSRRITTIWRNIFGQQFFISIFYCHIYKIGLNTSFTTYMKCTPVSCKHRSDREHNG
jgi:hypothetical protein